jgi:hypothetical protein
VLPNGQILMSDTTNQLWLYTPVGGPQNVWRPTIKNVVNNGNGTFTLTGTQITGLDEGSNYGDDRQNATNFPIVRLTNGAGQVVYARTFNWSTTNVATGSANETVQFLLPSGFNTNNVSFVVIANGIPSLPFSGNKINVYYPFRYLTSPGTDIYSGSLTVQNLGLFTVSGTVEVFFPKLPAGVTLVNASGKTATGVPFIKLTTTIPVKGSVRIPLVLANPLRAFLSTFFLGFPVQVQIM